MQGYLLNQFAFHLEKIIRNSFLFQQEDHSILLIWQFHLDFQNLFEIFQQKKALSLFCLILQNYFMNFLVDFQN